MCLKKPIDLVFINLHFSICMIETISATDPWNKGGEEVSQCIQLWSTRASKIEDLKTVHLQASRLCHKTYNSRQTCPTSLMAVCDKTRKCVIKCHLQICHTAVKQTERSYVIWTWHIVINDQLNWISWSLLTGQEGILAMHFNAVFCT